MNIPGSWTLYYDWGCDGGVGNSKITFNANGTFASSPYTGKWVQFDGNVLWRFDQAPSAVYGGNGVGTALTGASSTFAGLNGCWYAIKSGSPGSLAESAEVQAATGKMDVAGNKPK